MWMSADEALARLNVKPQTLYANVSRGRLRAKPDPADPRRSLYRMDDVERLARRRAGRPRTAEVASGTIQWGDPIMPSALSTIVQGRLYYRGVDAVAFAETATLGDAARLLWDFESDIAVIPAAAHSVDVDGLGAVLSMLAARATVDPPSYGRSVVALRADASAVFGAIAATVCGGGEGPAHQRLAVRWQRPQAAEPLRRAMVLLADHELNASTFAARIAVSMGASLSAGTLAGLATLSGPLHGMAASAVQGLAARASSIGVGLALRERLDQGQKIPAFGHQLYPQGDVRAAALFRVFEPPRLYRELAEEGRRLTGEEPNVDFALAALGAVFDLPAVAPIAVFTLARSVGWLAHMLEQAASGQLIRPRSRYVGNPPIRGGDTEIPQNRAFSALK